MADLRDLQTNIFFISQSFSEMFTKLHVHVPERSTPSAVEKPGSAPGVITIIIMNARELCSDSYCALKSFIQNVLMQNNDNILWPYIFGETCIHVFIVLTFLSVLVL